MRTARVSKVIFGGIVFFGAIGFAIAGCSSDKSADTTPAKSTAAIPRLKPATRIRASRKPQAATTKRSSVGFSASRWTTTTASAG